MTEIKFKLVDGEPVCLGEDCPYWPLGKSQTCIGDPCIPGLCQQRDEARADLADREAVIGRVEGELEAAMETLTVIYSEFPTVRQAIDQARALTPVPATGKDATEGGEG